MLKQLPISKVVNNFITFQAGWFFSAYWHDTRALAINLLLVFWLYHAEPWSKLRIKFTLIATSFGVLSDSLLTYLGFIDFGTSLVVPAWFASLWLLFACTLSVSLSWVMRNPVLSILGGLLFGPLAYWSGAQFDALALPGLQSYLAISITWGALMFVFSFLYRRNPVNSLYVKSHEPRSLK